MDHPYRPIPPQQGTPDPNLVVGLAPPRPNGVAPTDGPTTHPESFASFDPEIRREYLQQQLMEQQQQAASLQGHQPSGNRAEDMNQPPRFDGLYSATTARGPPTTNQADASGNSQPDGSQWARAPGADDRSSAGNGAFSAQMNTPNPNRTMDSMIDNGTVGPNTGGIGTNPKPMDSFYAARDETLSNPQQHRSPFDVSGAYNASSASPFAGGAPSETGNRPMQQQRPLDMSTNSVFGATMASQQRPQQLPGNGMSMDRVLPDREVVRELSNDQRTMGHEVSRSFSGEMGNQLQQQLMSSVSVGWTGANGPPTRLGDGSGMQTNDPMKQGALQSQQRQMQTMARSNFEGAGAAASVGFNAQQQQQHSQQTLSARPSFGGNDPDAQHEENRAFGMPQRNPGMHGPPTQDRSPPTNQSLQGSSPHMQQQQHHHHQSQLLQQGGSPDQYGGNTNGNSDQQQQLPPQGAAGGIFGNVMGQGGPPGGMRELRVEDALLYLDDVKKEFKDRPAIYNEFLAIMKNFKSQEVDTPGVINRVSKLFRGYNNLILGFNTFLPDGFKISMADLERAEALRVAEEQAEAQAKAKKLKAAPGKRMLKPGQSPLPSNMQQGGTLSGVKTPGYRNSRDEPDGGQWEQSPEGQSPHQNPPQLQYPEQAGQGPRGPFNQNAQQSPPQQHQAVEFDHAISYVTTIKKRFASDPNTYHSFLEILHNYQKEQRGIKEVLEQVAHLFQDHPDLLKEFTFFLPDAVQEQAKERLHRAAAESESRIAAQRQLQTDRYHQGMDPQQQQLVDMTRSRQLGSPEIDGRGRKRQADGQQVGRPETYVYNSAVERQFFDSVREAVSSFSRDSGQAWAEVLKCIHLYSQEVLERSEMMEFVEALLSRRFGMLLDEFKRILTAAGSPTSTTQLMEDAWYSVPLAEIDFSRCRRCTPSYRALPRDYPAHPCSERSEEEAKVLNDLWVSLPVGSEESYTFRHMRRNTYEETLFRVEDERFEIDMAVDTNAATLQRLLPIAEEIALLSQEDVVPSDLGIKQHAEVSGLGGKRFQYTFDKKILGVIHRNTITRIYGDNGQEILDLLVRNPTVAVPLVVERLRQKDEEWRAVRDRLNRQWKELAESNYYKSLDHRSLTWRTTDKRLISARTLISEIKDRAANGGRESMEAYRQRLDKAKEEHGAFIEVTVGEKLSQELDLAFLPKPDRRLFTPHLTLNYKNVSWAQRDAYRILAFALERGPISPSDKERCHRLWVEFLGPWFDLSFNWMQKPAVTYQESSMIPTRTVRLSPAATVSEDDEESLDEDPELSNNMVTEELSADSSKDKEFTDHHPLPSGAHVSTLYGEGKILEFRRSSHIYAVRLGFGAIGYLRPATVLCSMLPVEKSAYTRQLRAEDRTKLARPNDQLAFGTQNLYVFFRLHEILLRRLNAAKQLAYSVGEDQSLQSMVEQMPNVNPKAVGRRRYEAYLSLVYALLDGGVGASSEGGKYEDRVRSLLGHGAFELATMDKLIAHIWKEIQTMANDETMWSLVQLYRRHMLAGSFQPEAFRQEAAYLSDGEPMYAFQHCPLSSSDESVLHTEYLGVMDDEGDDENAVEEEVEPVAEPVVANKRPKRRE